MPQADGEEHRAPREVLIVDDDTDVRESLRDVLLDEGYSVAAASNGADALRQLESRPQPGIILLDLMMPGMNGWGVLERLRGREATAQIPVAVISAQRGERPAGSDVVLEKPIRIERLLDVVATYCAAPDREPDDGSR
ncbi:MAG TPA: response regulator [Minicystis sp.]|nr:response regulator [Minicystis sp.]